MKHLQLHFHEGVATVTLNRPEVRNAFNDEVINELTVAFCRNADLPVNCLPSLHVSTVVLCLATQWHRTPGGQRAVPLGLPASLAMIASTLTFKQHYLVDVLAGAALGFASWWLCFRWRRFTLRG